ncbi:hypothetical protein KPA96_04655 [Burkholderia cenocepacia]|uniref:hypothetical protein n=2 Tax=Burkholderia TaxID=32008 RepID=UPI002857E986|nr:hypothetical protein [Burkholderia cenocepacia]MDR8074948.1 hypothetical protein [Burkholderia cenocepacia]
MSQRDDFSKKVRQAVAANAGWHCAFTGCGKLTVGPSDEGADRSTTIGEAAHIHAAAPGGRRYDATMTPEARSSIDNAIWLCVDHARLIDRDSVTYTAPRLRAMKQAHEDACKRAVRTGQPALVAAGLLAIGPEIVCTGDLTQVDASGWTLRLGHFLIGDLQGVVDYIDRFGRLSPEDRYVLSNELGDGRVLAAAPVLAKQDAGYHLRCTVAPGAARVDVSDLGSGWALHAETDDLYLDDRGAIARVSGVDYLPQRVREVLSMQQGESPLHPSFGVRFFEYFQAYRGSPWLDLLLKLEVVRQASVPYSDPLGKRETTPLRCVTRVRQLELLAEAPTNQRLPIRLELEIQGLGRWAREIAVYLPTAEQMSELAQRRGRMAGLFKSPGGVSG